MSQIRNEKDERMFTIELESKGDVMSLSWDGDEKVLNEGSIGSLKHAHFLEEIVLDVIGSNGVLRMDLTGRDLESSIKSLGPQCERGSDQ